MREGQIRLALLMKKWGMLSVEVGFQILFAKSIEISLLAILKWNFFPVMITLLRN